MVFETEGKLGESPQLVETVCCTSQADATRPAVNADFMTGDYNIKNRIK